MFTQFNGKAGKITKRNAKIGKEELNFEYFIPAEIPPISELCIDLSLMEKSNEANRAIGELQGLTKNIGHLDLFVEPYIRKEAVDSSEIEGTVVSLTDVFLSEAGSKKPEFTNPNIKEVVNFVKAINHSISELKNGKTLSKELINNMHGILLNEVRGKDFLVGEYRKQQNWIRNKTSRGILDAVFVPPSEEKVEDLMNYLFSYINESQGHMRLIRAGLIHYYFETIHPYEDGNGRVGRTLILLYLIQKGVLENPILYLSPYFKKYKDNYYSLLMEVRETGNYSSWLKFFLDGVTEISINTSKKVKKLIELYNDYKKRLTNAHATPMSFKVLDKFFERPYSFISLIQEQMGNENYPKTKRAMIHLVDCGIIKQYTKYKRNKIYVASEILRILEEDLI
ncbi:MAG TPA: Fic/DOC family N-terminal domain-containing protein [Candidatus Nanoarchaeia archaeon]|nr:Fic/DOC family N-terminal domain-containing protein [Candidatus Nanoarchaeia archaeon]